MKRSIRRHRYFLIGILFVAAAVFIVLAGWRWLSLVARPLEYDQANASSSALGVTIPPPRIVKHLSPPASLRAAYMTSWVAGTPRLRQKLIQLIADTELNAVVIDIKDYTGQIAFKVSSPDLIKIGSAENRIADITDLLDELHYQGVYIIGRVAVFQDPYLVKQRPDLAVKRASNPAVVWTDWKKISWLDPGAIEVWDYTVAIATEAYKLGFDEINFDYVRFPSDGDMTDIAYPISNDPKVPKSETLRRFFEYLHDHLANNPKVPLSVDLFGMTMTNTDDLNIGQVLENALPYFDYVDPMVYPSHYPPTWRGFANPAMEPYKVIKFALDEGVKRTLAASSSPSKIRPWLQDFNLGAIYTADMVKAEMQATYDAGLTSWLLWDPKNIYTRAALQTASTSVPQN